MKNRKGQLIVVGAIVTLTGTVIEAAEETHECEGGITVRASDGRVYGILPIHKDIADAIPDPATGKPASIAQAARLVDTSSAFGLDPNKTDEELRMQFIQEAIDAGYTADGVAAHIAEVRLYGYRRGISFDDAEKAIAAAPGTELEVTGTIQKDQNPGGSAFGVSGADSNVIEEGEQTSDPTPADTSSQSTSTDSPTPGADSSTSDGTTTSDGSSSTATDASAPSPEAKIGDPNDRPNPETV